ncbi:hypothetical protein SAMN05216496_2262 [Pseudomonas sp. Z003-0.4C(8344-21)]|uniref:hypothetical protein n=1 Tax=Pseudomonas sp. Z003-0.4C(8344-21) TaxID=1855380 RepID=UPI00087BD309|nr:hypothetical protein [Pseudomonas sp. Z003-0.4C(8344-21)]SDS72659.1 hypothetical protein SAMN05216496_2262 [Pseudomonas sp. Z003-0.4C(8344-21)]
MVIFKVQADRIQSNNEAASAWVAVKISAVWSAPPGAPTQADVDALLPWKWETLAGGAVWTPHDPDAWALWTIDPADMRTARSIIAPLTVTAVSHLVVVDDLDTRLDAAITAITQSDGAIRPESLVPPDQQAKTNLAGTVLGFVERLASVPHPLPSASNVHALLEIGGLARPGELDGLLLIAAPRVTSQPGQAFDARSINPVFEVPDPRNPDNFHWSLAGPNHSAELKSSRVVSAMRAAPPTGRVLDLYDQTIAVVNDPLRTLPTADALAGLPQALADAMDPLARLRSVLGEGMREWIGKPANAAVLRADLGIDAPPDQVPQSVLKRMLDAIAVQVLGARYDAVGRFEVPLVEALEAHDDPATASLLTEHVASLPTGVNETHLLAGWRVEPGNVFGNSYAADDWARIAAASPFTRDHLLQLAGFDPAPSSSREEVKLDTDVLREIWSHAAAVVPVRPGELRGIRYLELPREQPGAGPRSLQLVQRFEPMNPPQAGTRAPAEGAPFANVSFERARANAALAFAAPFIEGVVSGRSDWSTALPGDVTDPLFERLSRGLRTLLRGDGQIEGLYQTLCHHAASLAGINDQDPLFDLLLSLLDAAAEEAILLGAALAPRVDPFDTVTQLPLPLSFQIDQLQTFSRHVDDWTRLAGYGLVARRTGAANETAFVSLNAARLYFGQGQHPAVPRDPNYLSDFEAVYGGRDPVSGEAADGVEREFVDPHPFAPGDQVGVSDAIAEYSNAWQTAPMPGQAALDSEGSAHGVESARFLYGSPGGTAPKLPTLTFGRTYKVRGHLIGQGGVLAPFVRHQSNPYVLRDDISDDAPGLTATIPYLRTVAVSGPSFSADAPPKLASVSLLADELPKRAPTRRLDPIGLRMNVDTSKGVPRMACDPGANGGLRFEFVVDATGPASFDLAIEAIDQPPHRLAVPIAALVKGLWHRLDVFRTGAVVLRSREVGIGTEDELRANVAWVDVAQSQLAYQPDAVSLRLASAMPVDVEAVRVVSITGSGGGATEVSESSGFDAPRAEPLLLDGLDRTSLGVGQRLSNGLVRSDARVRIDGPSIDRHTWERWVNCALFADGTPQGLKSRVATILNRLQSEGAQARTELADPAVSGLWLEFWRVFPVRERIGAPLTFFARGAEPLARPSVGVDVKVGAPDLAAGGSFAKDGDGKAVAVGIAGHVYELRARAIIRRQDSPFDGLVRNEKRFGPAVLEGFSAVTQTGEALFLGPSSVLPIEIATAQLPELDETHWKPDKVVPLRWEGSRRIVDLKLPANLFGGEDGGRRLLRYCASASLVPQHWTWRGRPDPKGQDRLFDRAFAQRRNNDHGSLELGVLRVNHALSLEPTVTSVSPTIVSRDLDWRGGWNLWRFGVRLTSRYRALFQTKADDLAVYDLHASRPDWRWLEREVPDAVNGRMIGKPPLVLVLPLTEAGTDDGLVPPLLALIAEPMHVNGNFGDDIAVAVDVARHPLPAFKLTTVPDPLTAVQKLKFLPEVGPDPIRTGAAHQGSAVALRLDGPIGYGFDLGSEAGRFTHSGYLVSPVRHRLEPWSMIKLKMRRIDWSGHGVLTESKEEPISVRGVWQPGSEGLDTSPDRVPFDGLVAQELAYESGKPFVVAFHNEEGNSDGPAGQRLELTIVETGSDWRVDASVLKVDTTKDSDWRLDPNAPNAGNFEFVRGRHRPSFRLILSARARPERDELWTPSGEVMVQVNLGEVEGGGNGWLTIFNLPIEAGHKESIANEPRVDLGVKARIERVRLSDFSPSIWCQFTVASSKIRIDRNGAALTVDVDGLDLKRPDRIPDNGWLSLVVHEGKMPRRMLPDVDPRAQDVPDMVEMRVAIFTEDAFDISHQVRERPVVALLLEDDQLRPLEPEIVTRAKRILWQEDTTSKPGRPGRWRLLRVLRRKDDEITNLGDLFAEPLEELTNDPADGRGIVLTVSRPFPKREH